MAISLSYFPILCGLLAALTSAKTVTYDFNVTWVNANPDGAFNRPTIGINGQWPIPTINADVNDTIIVNVDNQLGNQTTTLHFHGLYMNGSTHMDGPMQVSQCGIKPGNKFQYNFTITQPGTYWYHSHAKGQYPDGLRGPLIINDPNTPFKDMYDEEVVLTVSDWYHEQMQVLIPKFINKANPTGAEPVPNSALFNDAQNISLAMVPGRRYLFRMINMGAFAGQWVWFEGHNMTVLEVDGIYTQPAEATRIYLTAAQRYSFIITAKNETTANYAFVGSMDTDLFDTIPDGLNWNVSGTLVYNTAVDYPTPAIVDDFSDELDDYTLVPYDQEPLIENVDQSVELTVVMDDLGDGANYAFFNNITYTSPKVPTLYTVMSSGQYATNAEVYGDYTHSFVLEKDEVIQIVVNNADTGKHPFHLHGHAFQAVYRSDEDAGVYDPANTTFVATPMRRDTFMVRPSGHIVLRFRADNPGVWLFHCHIEWHVNSGLIATMIEAPLTLQSTLQIPQSHYDSCSASNKPTTGNAAGNTVNLLDLTGQNAPPAPLPAGFTARGIVALVFSVLAALLGMATITWYGMADMGAFEMGRERERVAMLGAEGSGSGSGSGSEEMVGR